MSGGVDIERLLTVGLTKKELAETLVDVYKQLEDLKRERAWHMTIEQPPKIKDSDETGFVWTFTSQHQICMEKAWNEVAKRSDKYPVWCKTPGAMPPEIKAKLIKMIQEGKA